MDSRVSKRGMCRSESSLQADGLTDTEGQACMRHELPCSQRWHPETPDAKSVFAY